MSQSRCCLNCNATSGTNKLFYFPRNNHLRKLWLSILAPTNPHLLLLSENQLHKRRVCERHFDRTQFDAEGKRIRYSYPCLLTEKEMFHGIPLANCDYSVLNEHNYGSSQEQVSPPDSQEYVELRSTNDYSVLNEHCYSSSKERDTPIPRPQECVMLSETDALVSLQEHQNLLPSTSKSTQEHQNLLPSTSKSTQEHQNLLPSTSKSTPMEIQRKVKPHMKSVGAKTRRYIKQCTKIASESLGDTSVQRLQNAQKYVENAEFLQNFEKLNKKTKAFLLMQLKLARKNKMARRFSLEDKLFALALMKQSPKGYKLLEKVFALPNKRTLSRLSEKVVFECGVNQNILDHIKISTRNWDTKKKLCSIVFDEVALSPHLTYDESKDRIHGFVEIAGERKPKFADHALVFMIRGVCSSWRQSIAYYFCEGTVSAAELKKILKEIVPKLFDTGLIPLALVSDQGSTFRSCYKLLKEDTAIFRSRNGIKNDGTVHISGHDLFIFYDPPHLLKGIRNNFLDKDMLFNGNIASWKDILYIYDLDNKSGHTRALPKLTAHHVDPKNNKKMKVKTAAQVLSARTAAMLNYTYNVHQHLNNSSLETMKVTAAAVEFFDELFDSVNESPGPSKGKLRCAVKPNSEHKKFWENAIRKLKDIKFIDKSSKIFKQNGKPRHVSVPSLNGWITTLESFLGLSQLLFSKFGVEYYYTRFLNQDPLENFFGRVRAINYRNTNPDASTFICAFKSLLMSNILSPHSQFSNCEEDDGDTLIDLNYLFENEIENIENEKENEPIQIQTPPPSFSKSIPEENLSNSLLENAINEKVRVQVSAYTAGYICRKMGKKYPCFACKKTYTAKEITGIHKFIHFREYKRLKNNNLRYPNENFLCAYRLTADKIHAYLNEECYKMNIKRNLSHLLNKSDMSWLGCESHKKPLKVFFMTLMIRLHCHNWCNIINKIMSGSIESRYVSKMSTFHNLALRKYNTYKLRKKKLNK